MFRARRIRRRRAIAKRGASARREEQALETRDEAPDPATEPAEQIAELAELREQGILSDEEFAAEKRKLLGL